MPAVLRVRNRQFDRIYIADLIAAQSACDYTFFVVVYRHHIAQTLRIFPRSFLHSIEPNAAPGNIPRARIIIPYRPFGPQIPLFSRIDPQYGQQVFPSPRACYNKQISRLHA